MIVHNKAQQIALEQLTPKLIGPLKKALTSEMAELLADEEKYMKGLFSLAEKIRQEMETDLFGPLMPEPRYASVIEFVQHQIVTVYVTTNEHDDPNWCPQWYLHPDVVQRLHAMWLNFEYLHATDPSSAMHTYLYWCGDAHMDWIMKESNVFAKCKNGHKTTIPLKTEVLDD